MKLTYDERYNIAYIRFHEKRKEVESVKVSDELVIDMAPDGTILVVNEATGFTTEIPLHAG